MTRPEIGIVDLTQVPLAERNTVAEGVEKPGVKEPILFKWQLLVVKTLQGLKMADPATGEPMGDIIGRYPDQTQVQTFVRIQRDIFAHDTLLKQVPYFIPDLCPDPRNFAIVLATHKKDSGVVDFESLLLPGFSQEKIEQITKDLENLTEQNPDKRISLIDDQTLETIFKEDKELSFRPPAILERPLPYGVFFPELLIGGWGVRKDLFSRLLLEAPRVTSPRKPQEKFWQARSEVKSLQSKPVLMFRNNEPKTETQNGLVFEVGKKKQEATQEVSIQEAPIEAKFSRLKPLSIFPSRRELAISQIASIIEKNSEKPGRETQAGISQIVKEKQVVVELAAHIIETQSSILTVENPAQEQARVEEQAVSPVSERQPQVEKENETVSLEKVIVGPERAIAQEVVVKEKAVEKTITIPLIEIAVATPVWLQGSKGAERVWLQGSKGAERVYTVGLELEPVRVTDQSVVIKTAAGVAMELMEEPETKTSKIATSIKNQDREVKVQPQDLILSVKEREGVVTPVIENAGGEEEVEEQGEPKVWAVRRFKIDHSQISIHEDNKPESGIEKLVWIINPHKDQKQPVILEFEPPKNQNQRLHAFLHFLRKVAKKVFGEDVIWTRNLAMIRADEPLETIREIEYYQDLLKGSYAQVFAFIN